jgi:predicted PP-loop superfamily ATPase
VNSSFGEVIKVVLIGCTSLKKKIALFRLTKKGQFTCKLGCPLIFQKHPSAGISTFSIERLLRLRRAGPSASLDKSAD